MIEAERFSHEALGYREALGELPDLSVSVLKLTVDLLLRAEVTKRPDIRAALVLFPQVEAAVAVVEAAGLTVTRLVRKRAEFVGVGGELHRVDTDVHVAVLIDNRDRFKTGEVVAQNRDIVLFQQGV